MKRQELISAITKCIKNHNSAIIDKTDQTIFEISHENKSQIIVIQLTKKLDIWVRLKEPRSGYYCESPEEFRHYFEQLSNNKIEVAIGYKDSIWQETTIVYTNEYSDLNPEYNYTFTSWTTKT